MASLLEHMKPTSRVTTSRWADEVRVISPEAASEPGKWRTERAEYLREIMDATCDPKVNEVVIQSSSQVGKTEFILNTVGRYVDHDPCSILIVLPTLVLAEAFSKTRLAPMIRDNDTLLAKFGDPDRTRDRANTIMEKMFPGGSITLAGANSPASLSSRPIRIVLCDEVDRFPFSAGKEGDPVDLAKKRTTTFWNRLLILTSTPTIAGQSRIEAAYNGSDQRKFWVPCPFCKKHQLLRWKNVKWPEGYPQNAIYRCEHCGHDWDDATRWGAVRYGEWRADAPFYGVAGFHLNEIYSPWVKLGDMAVGFIKAKKTPETLKVWVNTSLGETWDESGDRPDAQGLMARREAKPKKAPHRVLVISAGLDVQADRVEIDVVGWGLHEESWRLDYKVVYGDPSAPQLWNDVDRALLEAYEVEDGRKLGIAAACVDTGGHHTQSVYEYCSRRKARRIWAIKGMAGRGRPVWPKKGRSNNKFKVPVFIIGVDAAKESIYSRIKIAEPGPGYMHFFDDADTVYFEQLTSEELHTRYVKGFPVREWVKKSGVRNEALDCRVYAYAAMLSLNVNWDKLQMAVDSEVERIEGIRNGEMGAVATEQGRSQEGGVTLLPEAPVSLDPPSRQRQSLSRPQRGGFVNGWKSSW